MKRKPDLAVMMVALLSLLSVAPHAEAYLDPSTGSMILSAIVGLFATLGLAIKTYWYKLKALFRGGSDKKSAGQADSKPPQQPGPGDDGTRRS